MHRGAGQQLRRGAGLRPLLSIVVPVLNEGAVIDAFLDQLQAARRAGHEVVLVDGGSTDGTRARARGRVDRLLRARPGRGGQLNRGARAARGQWLWFLHADTRLPPDWLSLLEAACRQAEPGWGFFHVRLDSERPLLRLVGRLMNLRSCLTRVATGDQGIFVHRALFFAAGAFPPVPIMEDIALSRRLRRHRPHCIRTPLVTSARRWERQGVVRTILRMWLLRLAFRLGVSPRRLHRYYRPCASPDTGS